MVSLITKSKTNALDIMSTVNFNVEYYMVVFWQKGWIEGKKLTSEGKYLALFCSKKHEFKKREKQRGKKERKNQKCRKP